MTNTCVKWRLLAAVSLAAAALAGCGGDDDYAHSTPPAAAGPTEFSTFAKATFAAAANSTPVNYDEVVFNFDVNDEPTAFDAQIMSGTY